MRTPNFKNERGTVELVVLGLLAALIMVLALPMISDIGSGSEHFPKSPSVSLIR